MNSKRRSEQARRILDGNLKRIPTDIAVPKAGWVRAIREALGMTRTQLGRRMRSGRKQGYGLSTSAVQSLEEKEVAGTVTLDSLKRAAEALDCTLVYALVPNASLEAIVLAEAEDIARRIEARTKRTMQLEEQDYVGDVVRDEVDNLIGTSALWG